MLPINPVVAPNVKCRLFVRMPSRCRSYETRWVVFGEKNSVRRVGICT